MIDDMCSNRCPLCHARKVGKVWYTIRNCQLVECSFCKLVYLFPVPFPDKVRQLYNTNYYNEPGDQYGYVDYQGEAEAVYKTYRRRLSLVARIAGVHHPIRSVHEIGCALGVGLKTAQDIFRCQPTGSDISEEAVAACLKTRWICYQSDVIGRHIFGDGGRSDLVYFFDFIEHLTDVKTFLQWLPDCVADKGFVALTTPDMGGCLNLFLGRHSPSIKIPEHVCYFSSKILIDAFEKYTPFKLVASFIDIQYFTLDKVVRRIARLCGVRPPCPGKSGKRCIQIPNGMKLYIFQKL